MIKIDPNMKVSDLIANYPDLETILVEEFGFHCASCMFNEFDSLIEGASLHGIEDDDFLEMVEYLEGIVNKSQKN